MISAGEASLIAAVSQMTPGCRPRERMSSENELRLASGFSIRAATAVLAPWRRTRKPSADEAVERLPDGGPRQVQALGELPLAGERRPGLEQAVGQRRPHRHLELAIEHGRARVGTFERLAQEIEERRLGSGSAHRFGHEPRGTQSPYVQRHAQTRRVFIAPRPIPR